MQCMVAASAANVAVLIPEVNNMAAAAAIVALDSLLICIFYSSFVFQRSGIAALVQDPANGVIYNRPDPGVMIASVAPPAPQTAINPVPSDLRPAAERPWHTVEEVANHQRTGGTKST